MKIISSIIPWAKADWRVTDASDKFIGSVTTPNYAVRLAIMAGVGAKISFQNQKPLMIIRKHDYDGFASKSADAVAFNDRVNVYSFLVDKKMKNRLLADQQHGLTKPA